MIPLYPSTLKGHSNLRRKREVTFTKSKAKEVMFVWCDFFFNTQKGVEDCRLQMCGASGYRWHLALVMSAGTGSECTGKVVVKKV